MRRSDGMRCFQSPMAVDTNRVGDALLSPGIKGPQKSGRGPFTLLRLQKKRTQVFSSLPQTHFKKSGQKSKTSFKSPAARLSTKVKTSFLVHVTFEGRVLLDLP